MSSTNSDIEYLGIELRGLSLMKCLLIGVYNPVRTNNFDSFFNQLKDISLAYENIIICGGFNINLLRNDILAERFCDNVTVCNLYTIVNLCPTRFAPHCNPSLLDLMKS